jgi:membrane protease YdiL (CAAX protease family)
VNVLPQETHAPLILQMAAILPLLAGVVLDIKLLAQWRRHHAAWLDTLPAARTRLQARPWRTVDAIVLLGVIFLTSIPNLIEAIHPTANPVMPKVWLLTVVLLVNYGLIGGAIVFAVWRSRAGFAAGFGVTRTAARHDLRNGIVWGLACIPPVLLIAWLANVALDTIGFDTSQQEVFDVLSKPGFSMGGKLAIVGAAVLGAPMAEEMIFRGVLFPVFLRRMKWPGAALLVGALFAIMHFHLPAFVPLMALGAVFSLAMLATGSVLTSIVMHALFNLVSILIFFAFPDIPV